MAYQAWVTNAQTVLRQRREQARQEQAGQLTSGELCLGILQWGSCRVGLPGADYPCAQEVT